MVSECKKLTFYWFLCFFLVKGIKKDNASVSDMQGMPLICILLSNAAFECSAQKASFERMDHLRHLQNIIQATSREIMWINDCEEEELLYDWSDKNTNIAQKQEAFSVSHP